MTRSLNLLHGNASPILSRRGAASYPLDDSETPREIRTDPLL
ncbi:MAG: hypothetical protein ACRD3V_22830 [Vicinamibacteria bacterium]